MLIKYNLQNDTINWRDISISKDLALEKLSDDGVNKIVWYEGNTPEIVHKENLLPVFKYNEKDGLYITYESFPEIEYNDNQEIMQSISDLELRILELTEMVQKEVN